MSSFSPESATRTVEGTASTGNWFRRFAERTAVALGSPWAFGSALLAVVFWFALGSRFGYSPAWQQIINTGTAIIVFLMVFLLQNTQTRDSTALHLKLDELLRAVQGARTGFVGLEKLSDETLREVANELEEVSKAERDGSGGVITSLRAESDDGPALVDEQYELSEGEVL